MVHLITSREDLTKQLDDAGTKLVVIDFFAKWCKPCKEVAPQFEELAEEKTNVVFLKIDVDVFEDLSDEYGIKEMPTFVFIKEREVIEKFSDDFLDKVKETIAKNT